VTPFRDPQRISLRARVVALALRVRDGCGPNCAASPGCHGSTAPTVPAVVADLRVVDGAAGRAGVPRRPAGGVLVRRHRRLLKMSNDSALGAAHHLHRRARGGWFGEGTVLKNEVYRYNIQALRRSVVAGITRGHLPLAAGAQHRLQPLRDEPAQRTAGPVHRRARDRPPDHPDERVARSLAALFHPVLYPGVGELLRITQQELGYLVGLSRQRVNEALRTRCRAAGVIRVEYGGVRVLDLERPAARSPASRASPSTGWPTACRCCWCPTTASPRPPST
jgi:CRP/FNR family transcriptional regulator, cyclic AMP receptor protein